MRKFIKKFYVFIAHPVTHIVVGFLAMGFAWCLAYEIDYALHMESFVIGVVASAGYGCVDLAFQKLWQLRCS